MLLAEITMEPLQIGTIFMGLLGGLALFLFGMDQMSDALKLVAGDRMKKLLAKLTTNRFTGAIAGALVTAVIQSSSITTVLVVGFISAGLMTLAQSAGVIMGANVGTTVTAQIIAFKVTQYALVLVAVGFAILFCVKNKKVKYYGRVIMGLGLIFFGMQLMSDGTKPLREYQPFIDMMQSMDNPLMAILVAAAFTGIVQSSSATIGIVIVLAGQGFISLEAGIALIFGANIGTCITAMLASIGKSRDAVRAAVVHVIFNVLGVVVWFGLIGPLADVASWLSPKYPELAGIQRLSAETPRQIANAHTIFNVANTLIFIWMTGPIVRLAKRVVREKPEVQRESSRPKYLDDSLIQTPSLAMDIVRMELGRLGAAAAHMVRSALETVIRGSDSELAKLEQMDNDVDRLHGAIVTYLGRLSQENLSDQQSEQLHDFLAAANYIENIGDMIETNLVDAGRQRLNDGLEISAQTQRVLEAFHDKVAWSVERAVQALVENNPTIAAEVMDAKSDINRLAADAEDHLSRRLAANEPKRLVAFRLESEIMEYLKRMYYFAKRIAKVVAECDMAYSKRPEEPMAADRPATTRG
jgi:phosphate:Na+ symporter